MEVNSLCDFKFKVTFYFILLISKHIYSTVAAYICVNLQDVAKAKLNATKFYKQLRQNEGDLIDIVFNQYRSDFLPQEFHLYAHFRDSSFFLIVLLRESEAPEGS